MNDTNEEHPPSEPPGDPLMADGASRPPKSEADARERPERRQAFLLRLSDALRPLADSAEMESAAMRVLAEELGVNVLYGGHYATETFGVKALAAALSRRFKVPWIFLDHPSGL